MSVASSKRRIRRTSLASLATSVNSEVVCTSREFSQPRSFDWTSEESNASAVETLIEKFAKLAPSKMINDKGDCGKVCIVGGSSVHTGPAFYAGDIALRCGVDIVIVVTTVSAAIPLKSYSSALTVVPYLPEKNDELSCKFIDRLWPIVKDCHAFCIGPGLGKDKVTLSAVQILIKKIGLSDRPIVLNSGALCLLNGKDEFLSCVPLKAVSVVILEETEFVLMWDAVCSLDVLSYDATVVDAASVPEVNNCPVGIEFFAQDHPNIKALVQTQDVAGFFGSSVAVVRSGVYDIVTQAGRCFVFGAPHLRKRCRNQGDLLAGLTTIFLAWQKLKNITNNAMEAACVADVIIKLAILDAVDPCGRLANASDVTNCVPAIFNHLEELFDKEDS